MRNEVNLMKFWKISPGEGGYLWREQKLNECIAIGWSEIGDAKGKDKTALHRMKFEGKPLTGSAARQINAFVNEVQIGDKVIASTSGKGV